MGCAANRTLPVQLCPRDTLYTVIWSHFPGRQEISLGSDVFPNARLTPAATPRVPLLHASKLFPVAERPRSLGAWPPPRWP